MAGRILVFAVLETVDLEIRDPDEVHREFKPASKDSPVDCASKLIHKLRRFLEPKGLGKTLLTENGFRKFSFEQMLRTDNNYELDLF